jgi:hypothetical protein
LSRRTDEVVIRGGQMAKDRLRGLDDKEPIGRAADEDAPKSADDFGEDDELIDEDDESTEDEE